MLTTKEIREKSDDQLRNELAERQKHLFDLRSQAVTEKLEDPSQLRKTRKEIARIKTVARQRELEAQPKQPAAEPKKPATTEQARAANPGSRRRKPRHTKADSAKRKAKRETATA